MDCISIKNLFLTSFRLAYAHMCKHLHTYTHCVSNSIDFNDIRKGTKTWAIGVNNNNSSKMVFLSCNSNLISWASPRTEKTEFMRPKIQIPPGSFLWMLEFRFDSWPQDNKCSAFLYFNVIIAKSVRFVQVSLLLLFMYVCWVVILTYHQLNVLTKYAGPAKLCKHFNKLSTT